MGPLKNFLLNMRIFHCHVIQFARSAFIDEISWVFSKILNKNPTEIDFELRSSWLAMACRYLVSWCWMGIRVHVVWSIWSTGAMA